MATSGPYWNMNFVKTQKKIHASEKYDTNKKYEAVLYK